MRNVILRFCLNAVLVITGFLLAFPSPVKADGGPIVSGSELWAQLKEGQQTAVVTLKDNNTVDVDLFVSLLDSSGQSHEVVFFVPLGTGPTDFSVIERTSLDFDRELTEELDEALRKEAQSRRDIRLSLLSAMLLTNGGWMLPLWFPVLLSGCAHEASPEATYETDSSHVGIYGLDEDTDLEVLINTTGLDPSVQETLSRLRGQRIAIVTLQTQPPLPNGDSSYRPAGQPGIHLAWTTKLTPQSATAAYSYPLGTGSSWAHPIELTRVYVVAPPGVDFTVQYPRLGNNHSGFTLALLWGSPRPRIADHYDTSAYAVDEARGNFGHIWRATYSQSNSAEDIVIVAGSSTGFLATLRRVLVGWGIIPNGLVGLLVALVLWVVAWRYIMPRMVRMECSWRSSRIWRDSLIYPGINAVIVLAVVSIVGVLYLLWPYIGLLAGLILAVLVILPTVLGIPGIWLFLKRQWPSLDVYRSRAVMAYIVVALATNFAYLALVSGYAALIGVI